MTVDEVNSKNDLQKYLDVHPTVKDSLIGDVLNKCEEFYSSEKDIFDLLAKRNFLNKFKEVIRSSYHQNKDLLELILEDSIQKRDISKIISLDILFKNREGELIRKLFSQELNERELFDCIVIPDNISGIRSKACKRVKDFTFDLKRLLIFLNSLNYVLFRKSSLLINLWPEYLEEEYISNAVYEYVKRNDKKLLEIRDYLIQWFISHNKEKVNFLFLTDLIEKEDIAFLKSINLNDSLLSWIKLEQEIKEMVPITDVDDTSYWLVDEELHPFIMDVGEIVEKLTNTTNSWEYEHLFNVLKIKIHFYNQIGELEELNFKQILNEPLVAYYVKTLHDLDVFIKIPKMSDTFNWPNLEIVNRYLNKFNDSWNEQSPLTRLEYHVGISSALSKNEREEKLKYAFRFASIEELGEQWGLKGTPTRLKYISNHIANQIKLFRRHKYRNMDVAISQWEEDLNYLKEEFYDDKCAVKFVWPLEPKR